MELSNSTLFEEGLDGIKSSVLFNHFFKMLRVAVQANIYLYWRYRMSELPNPAFSRKLKLV